MKTPSERRDDTDDHRSTILAAGLKARYDEVAREPIPDRLRELLERLDNAESRER